MNVITDPKHPVILFIPEAGIYPFLRGLSVLGDVVKKKGGRVLVTEDDGVMLRTPMMAKHLTPLDASAKIKAPFYKAIRKNLKSVQKKYGFEVIRLSNFIDEKTIKEIHELVDKTQDDLRYITFRNFAVGKIAQYDFILETKCPYTPELSTNPEYRALYAIYVKNTALSLAIADAICEKYAPSLMLTFNEYAQCQAVRQSAQIHNVGRMALTYPVHFNTDGSRFSVWKSTYEYWRYMHCQRWNENKVLPIEPKHVEACWEDALFRMYATGSHIFSSRKKTQPGELFKTLNLDPRRKTIIAYTSSNDERVSVKAAMDLWKEDPYITDAFPTQIEWLRTLRDYALLRNDIQIVVRIHPREGARQFGFDSEHLKELKEAFGNNEVPNFVIVWPNDPISSYDLIELADITLVAWSFMGQEAARLGIPVLSYTANMTYADDDIVQVASTKETYIKKLEALVKLEPNKYHLTKAIRLYHWRNLILTLDLGETVPRDFSDENLWPEAPASKIDIIHDLLADKKEIVKYNKEIWQESLVDDSPDIEWKAVQKGIRMFLDVVFSPPAPVPLPTFAFRVHRKLLRICTGKTLVYAPETKPPVTDYELIYAHDTSHRKEWLEKTQQNPKLRVIMKDGIDAILVYNGVEIRRTSPLAIRLAKLYNE